MAIAREISLKTEVIFFRAIFFLIVSCYCVVASVRYQGAVSKDGVGQSRGSRKIWGYPPELWVMSLDRFNMVGSCFRMGL